MNAHKSRDVIPATDTRGLHLPQETSTTRHPSIILWVRMRFRNAIVVPNMHATKRIGSCLVTVQTRSFSSTQRRSKQTLRSAWNNTRTQWGRPVPIGLTIAALGGLQFYRVSSRERARAEEERQLAEDGASETDSQGRPKKRPRIRPSGPWYVAQLCTDEHLPDSA